jgi:aspartate aminotransferase-like enzyme
MKTAAAAPARGLYFDLVEFEQYARKHQTPNTPALPLLYALDVQLAHIVAEGVEARWARHDAMARRTWAWAAGLGVAGMGVLAPEGARSPTVTAVTLPVGLTGPVMAERVARQGYVVGSGYGKLRETTFRIGHMGDHTVAGLEGCLAACDAALGEVAGSATVA